ncbi:PstS family phosphate ABC transporter substrate-binding protein [Litchfieldella xinjiangensis]|uniref:PstS family phosphate ABC transporter substrate-binding protein n=1 Tax=Litchfieldella xinjiangensis TaxID=1166948 RepID=UPI0005B7B982|nr:phosphate ABC transporter substrate-binding protein [Halomonas xinjiangensis]
MSEEQPRVRRALAWMVFCLVGFASIVAHASPPVSGSLGSIGSETLAGLMLRWGEQLEAQNPGVRLQIQASGSSTAPPALTAGTTRLGPMSRPMSEGEHQAFIDRQGYAPLRIPVAMDALAVFVHRHNPIEALSLAEVDALFSDTRRCGAEAPIDNWRALGQDGGRIVLHSRNSASGTYGIFKRMALCGGDFRRDVNEYPGSAAVVAAVARSRDGIGYAGMSYLMPSVRAVALRSDEGQAVLPESERVLDGSYPLARTLYLYVNRPPDEPLPQPESAFLDLVLSSEGQATVREAGFVPLPEPMLEASRDRLGLPGLASP